MISQEYENTALPHLLKLFPVILKVKYAGQESGARDQIATILGLRCSIGAQTIEKVLLM